MYSQISFMPIFDLWIKCQIFKAKTKSGGKYFCKTDTHMGRYLFQINSVSYVGSIQSRGQVYQEVYQTLSMYTLVAGYHTTEILDHSVKVICLNGCYVSSRTGYFEFFTFELVILSLCWHNSYERVFIPKNSHITCTEFSYKFLGGGVHWCHKWFHLIGQSYLVSQNNFFFWAEEGLISFGVYNCSLSPGKKHSPLYCS